MNTNIIPKSRAEAINKDQSDPLGDRREKFVLDPSLNYLVGHSLGPATRAALEQITQTAQVDWAEGLIRSWNGAGWIDLPKTVGSKLARLIGVPAEDVIICDSVSINLFKLAAAVMPLIKSQPVLIVEEDEFPTDQYMLDGLSKLANITVERIGAGDGESRIANGGILVKSAVNYRTALVADIAAHEAAARKGGGFIIWDLSHATGIIDLDLAANGAKLATGCTYKYVNGGPGAPAFIYADGELTSTLRSPLSGWFGHKNPFAFTPDYQPEDGVARFAAGTPGILSLAALDGTLSIFDGLAVSDLQNKTQGLVSLCLARAEALGLKSISPKDPARRGGHVSLLHENGYPIVQALIARNIIPDFRAPNAMRFGFSPLYIRYVDVWDAMDALSDILETRAWDKAVYKRRSKVT